MKDRLQQDEKKKVLKKKTKKRSRILAMLSIVSLILCLMPATAHADPDTAGCTGSLLGTHNWVSQSVAPTCTTDGAIYWMCRNCGKQVTETIPATGHNWDWGTVTAPATCTTDGIITYRCQICGTTLTQAIPATGHTIAIMPARAATCEEVGLTEGQYCSTCGEILLYQYSSPALGHDWDEGVVQGDADALLHDHDIVYTCSRCGKTHTETAKIEAANFWSTVYKPAFKSPPGEAIHDEAVDLLYIKEQPKDLEIDWEEGNMGMLTIEAGGGTEPYTYYWTMVPDIVIDRSEVGRAFIADMEEIGSSFEEGLQIAQSFGKAEHDGNEISSAKPRVTGSFTIISGDDAITEDISKILEDGDKKTSEYELLPAGAFTTRTNVPELQVEVGSASGYTAWCIVYDDNGDHVRSNKVKISPAFKIIQQPQNVNFDDPEAVFTIEAAYGKEPYTYQWQAFAFLDDDTYQDIEISDAPDAQTDTLAPLYWFTKVRCVVTDDTGKSLISEPAELYTAPVLELSTAGDVFIRPGEDASISATFTGGVAPYTAAWTKAGGDSNALVSYTVEEEPAGDEYTYVLDTTDESVYGDYVFTVEDSLGQRKEAVVNVSYRDLTIIKQPEGGQLDIDGNIEVSIEMGEGTMPFTYSLREVTHEEIASETTDSAVWSQTLHESMIYYIYVEDANGLHAESNYFWVGDYEVKITQQPDEIEITNPESYAEADLLIEGGEGPYKLTWYKLNEETGDYEKIETTEGHAPTVGYAVGYGGSNGPGISALLETEDWAWLMTIKTGTYYMEAVDANKVKGVSKPFKAVYTGSRPYITVQPQDAEYEIDSGRGGRSNLTYTLDCEAETATGDYVYYIWEQLNENGGWSPVPRQTFMPRNAFNVKWADYPHQEFNRVDESRVYRCKAVNKITKEYTYSEPAFVRVLLKCVGSGQSGKDTAIWAEYVGGALPVDIYVREKFPPDSQNAEKFIGTDGNNRDYTLNDFMVLLRSYGEYEEYWSHYYSDDFSDWLADHSCLVTPTEKYIMISDITGGIYCNAGGLARRWRENGHTSSYDYEHRIYQLMIQDRFGDTCTAPWLRMTSPMTDAEKAYNIFFYGILGFTPDSDHSGW